MKNYSMVFRKVLSVLALGLLMAGGAALAQDSTEQNMPPPQVDTQSCAQVQWAPQIVSAYPRMPQACQEVLMVNDVKWVRFGAKLVRMRNNVALLDIQNPHGGSLGTFRMRPAADAKIKVEGEEYSYWQVPKGHVLNFYIQEGKLGIATEPSEPEAEMAVIEPPPAMEVAETEPAESPAPATMPETAGPLPWVALSGIVFILVGLGLSLRRRLA